MVAEWETIPCLLTLREEFNALSPKRDKGADGTIGDTNHTSGSDHTPDESSDKLRGKDSDKINEVHALDVDSTGPWPRSFKSIVLGVIAKEKKRWLDPNDVCRLEYVIMDGLIYSRSRDFEPVKYTGGDPHTNHAHFSARYITKAENDTSSWGVKGDDSMSAAEVNALKVVLADFKSDVLAEVKTVAKAAAKEVWATKVGSKAVPNRSTLQAIGDLEDVRAVGRFPSTHAEAKAAGYPADSPLMTLYRQVERIDDIEAKVDQILAILKAPKSS